MLHRVLAGANPECQYGDRLYYGTDSIAEATCSRQEYLNPRCPRAARILAAPWLPRFPRPTFVLVFHLRCDRIVGSRSQESCPSETPTEPIATMHHLGREKCIAPLSHVPSRQEGA